MIKKIIADFHATSVYSLDIEELKLLNIKLAFIDLDNTLAQYDLLSPEKRTYELIKKYKDNGIEVVILSNNREKRVSHFVSKLKVKYISSCHKPFKSKIKKYIISNCIETSNAIIIGDQLLTDVMLAHALNMKCVLTEPISKIDQFTTRFNRLIDRPLRKKYLKENRLGININVK